MSRVVKRNKKDDGDFIVRKVRREVAAKRAGFTRAPTSEWYKELEAGIRDPFTGRGSRVVKNYENLIAQFEATADLEQARKVALEEADRASTGFARFVAPVASAVLGAERVQSGYDKTLELLSRTSKAGVGTGFDVTAGENPLPGIGKALSGNEERTASDRLKERGMYAGDSTADNIARGTTGFLLDVLLDPLTYAGGVGLIRRGASSGASGIDDALRAVDDIPDAPGVSPAGAVPPPGKIKAGGSVPVRVETVNRAASPSDISVPATGHLLHRVEQQTGHRIVQSAYPGFQTKTRTAAPAPTEPIIAPQVAKQTTKKTPKSKASPVAAGSAESPFFKGQQVYVPQKDGSELLATINNVYPDGKISYFLQGAKSATVATPDDMAKVRILSDDEVAEEFAKGAPKPYTSPHLDRDKPLVDGLPRLTVEASKKMEELARRQLEKELVAATQAAKQSGVQVIPAKGTPRYNELLEQEAKAAHANDPSLKDLPDNEQFSWKDVLEDADLLQYYQSIAEKRIAAMASRSTAVSAPTLTREAIKERARALAKEFKQRELDKEAKTAALIDNRPKPKPNTKTPAAAPKQEPVVTADASDTPAVSKTTKHATKVATAEATLKSRPLSPAQLQAVDAAVADTITTIASKKFKARYQNNPARQRNLFNKINAAGATGIRGNVKKTAESETSRAQVVAAYRIAEERVARETGLPPGDYKGAPWALSDVIEALPKNVVLTDELVREITEAVGGKVEPSPMVREIIDRVRAEKTIEQTEMVAPTIQKVEDVAEEAKATLPEAQADEAIKQIPEQAAKEARAAGVNPTIVDAVKAAARDIINGKYPPVTVAGQVKSTMPLYNAKTYTYRASKEAAEKEYEAVHSILEQQRKYLGFRTIGNKWVTLGGRGWQDALRPHIPELRQAKDVWGRVFITSYQMSNVQPTLRMYEAGAETLAKARADELDRLFRDSMVTPDSQMSAWQSLRPGGVPSEDGLKIRDTLQRWWGSKDSFLASNGLNVYDLNYMLQRLPGYKFQIEKKFEDHLGKVWTEKDFDDPFDFLVAQMTGSKNWNIKEHGAKSPVAGTMYDLMMTSERLAAEVHAVRHLGDVLGTPKKVRGWVELKTAAGDTHPAFRTSPRYFPPEIAAEWKKYEEIISTFTKPNTVGQTYDRAIALWKNGVLLYNPGFHARNMYGDVFLTFLAGHTSIRHYTDALRVLRHAGGVRNGDQYFKPFDKIDEISASAPDTVIVNHKNLGKINVDQIILGFEKYGGAQNIAITENLGTGLTHKRTLMRPFGGAVNRAARNVSDIREDYGRMAHFIAALKKSKASNLDDAMRDAMAEVRKFHFDYGDLTQAEIRVMRRIAPFYTWLRKSVPLLIEQAAARPWKMAVVPKLNYAIAEMSGQDPQDFANPFPAGTEDMFPQWVHDSAAVPWFQTEEGNYVTGSIEDPFSGNLTDFDQPIEGSLGVLNPAAKLVLETIVGRSDESPYGTRLATGIPITDRTRYWDQQIPIASAVGRMTNTSPVFGALEEAVANPEPGTGFRRTTNPDTPGESGFSSIALLNFLTGLGLQENTPQRQLSAEYEQQKRAARG